MPAGGRSAGLPASLPPAQSPCWQLGVQAHCAKSSTEERAFRFPRGCSTSVTLLRIASVFSCVLSPHEYRRHYKPSPGSFPIYAAGLWPVVPVPRCALNVAPSGAQLGRIELPRSGTGFVIREGCRVLWPALRRRKGAWPGKLTIGNVRWSEAALRRRKGSAVRI